ncbi:hypothetical protein KKG52_00815 [Patescibacteria group bacterium]|nr:hypothetical protein [Patescibacteria group bacterium]
MRLSARKIVFSLVLFFLITSVFFSTKVFAQYYPDNLSPNVPRNLHNNLQVVLIESLTAINCQLTGIDISRKDGKCLGVNYASGEIGFVENSEGGAVGFTTGMIASLYNPPFHITDYTGHMAANFGIVKPAMAATGFEGLNPVMKIWEVIRNMTYVVYILVFLFIGIGVMLRVKIDPRTIMTIQNQIPKVIASLLIITFSFAISGFLIDLMWIIILFTFSLFGPIDPTNGSQFSIVRMTENLGASPFGFLNSVMSGHLGLLEIIKNAAGSISHIVYDLLMTNTVIKVITIVLFEGPLGWGARIINGVLPGDPVPIIGAGQILIGGVAALIITIAILFALFRVWFMLLKAYITILLDVILAPVWIMAGLFPGVSGGRGFGPWMRHIGTNLLTFPTTIGFFLIGKLLMDGFSNTKDSFVPPLIGSASADSLAGLIGLGIILMAPKVHDFIQDSLKPPKIDLSPVFGALGAGTGALTSSVKQTAGVIRESKEARINPNAAPGTSPYEETGLWRAFKRKATS